MGEKEIKHMLSGMSPAAKKDLIDGLVVHILGELGEDIKKEILQTVIAGRKESRQLSAMVEH